MVKIDITKEPYLSIDVPAMVDVIKALAEWIAGYIKACLAIPEVQGTIEGIPEKTKAVGEGLKEEFSELDPFSLAKMMKSVLKCISKIKDVCEAIVDEMKELLGEFKDLKGAFELV